MLRRGEFPGAVHQRRGGRRARQRHRSHVLRGARAVWFLRRLPRFPIQGTRQTKDSERHHPGPERRRGTRGQVQGAAADATRRRGGGGDEVPG